MATKFETKWAILSLCDRYLRDPCAFRGRAIERCLTNSTTTDAVAVTTKFETKTDITRLM